MIMRTYWIVASTIFFGKSAAPTSPATPITSPPAALISSTTAFSRFSSILKTDYWLDQASWLVRVSDLLADDDLRALFREN